MPMTSPDNVIKIAKAFTDSRAACGSLTEYPGDAPQTLDEAYAIQDAAIAMWPHKVAGWKVGGVPAALVEELGETKIAGPVFENQIYPESDAPIDMPVFAEGFAAIEGEIVIIMSKDAPADKTDWTLEDAADYVGKVHMGVEIASSPFVDINNISPMVTISDFGNNNGLIIGPEISDWNESNLENWTVETVINGVSMGTATPPGPLIAFRFLLENAARRGMPLKKGMAVTTGAITGVHQAYRGDISTIKCSGVADIDLTLVDEK